MTKKNFYMYGGNNRLDRDAMPFPDPDAPFSAAGNRAWVHEVIGMRYDADEFGAVRKWLLEQRTRIDLQDYADAERRGEFPDPTPINESRAVYASMRLQANIERNAARHLRDIRMRAAEARAAHDRAVTNSFGEIHIAAFEAALRAIWETFSVAPKTVWVNGEKYVRP